MKRVKEGAFDEFMKTGNPELVTKEQYESWVKASLRPGKYAEVVAANGERVLQSFIVLVLGKEGERTDGTVNFRCHYALRKKSSRHTHRIVFSLFYQAVDCEWCKERDIAFFQIFHHIVAHASVCHIDNSVRSYFTDELHETGERRRI